MRSRLAEHERYYRRQMAWALPVSALLVCAGFVAAPGERFNEIERKMAVIPTARRSVACSCAAAFRGPCDVTGDHLVDREAGLFIRSRDMIHVMVEVFEPDLPRMVVLQRLLAALVAERVAGALAPPMNREVRRRGDDVFVGSGKFTVSIATVSPVSALIHLGVNVDNKDTPVPTAALGPLGIDPEEFARELLEDLRAEWRGIGDAICKVPPVSAGGEEA